MLAFTNTTVSKEALISQLEAHYRADEIVQGKYWEEGKGCAVGCSIHSDNHAEYEPRFGIPEALARLEDTIFEGLPNAEAKEWPLQFTRAIRPGADLSKVSWQFNAWVLANPEKGCIRFAGDPKWGVAEAVQRVADLCGRMVTGDKPTRDEWYAAARAARAAAYAAYAANAAADAARAAAYRDMRDKLIELLEAA